MRNAVQLDNVVPEGACDRGGREGVTQRHKVCVFGEPVDDDHDDLVALGRRQSPDEVHREVVPWLSGHGKGLEQPARLDVFVLGVLAHRALANEILHDLLETMPSEAFLHALVCRRHAGVATNSTCVEGVDRLGLEGRVGANP